MSSVRRRCCLTKPGAVSAAGPTGAGQAPLVMAELAVLKETPQSPLSSGKASGAVMVPTVLVRTDNSWEGSESGPLDAPQPTVSYRIARGSHRLIPLLSSSVVQIPYTWGSGGTPTSVAIVLTPGCHSLTGHPHHPKTALLTSAAVGGVRCRSTRCQDVRSLQKYSSRTDCVKPSLLRRSLPFPPLVMVLTASSARCIWWRWSGSLRGSSRCAI